MVVGVARPRVTERLVRVLGGQAGLAGGGGGGIVSSRVVWGGEDML